MTEKTLQLTFMLLLVGTSFQISAETIFCKYLEMGCQTQEEKQQARRECDMLAESYGRDVAREVATDPTIWQFDGAASASAYVDSQTYAWRQICYEVKID